MLNSVNRMLQRNVQLIIDLINYFTSMGKPIYPCV
jgi:isochorismate hydrolase